MIELTFFAATERTRKYKTLRGAMKAAHTFVTDHPKRADEGHAVHPRTGACLFFSGCNFENLFPKLDWTLGLPTDEDEPHGLGYMQGSGAS